jgi:hypothetical protein
MPALCCHRYTDTTEMMTATSGPRKSNRAEPNTLAFKSGIGRVLNPA